MDLPMLTIHIVLNAMRDSGAITPDAMRSITSALRQAGYRMRDDGHPADGPALITLADDVDTGISPV